MSQLYTSQPTVNRLLTTFSSLFPSATRRTRHLLAWLLIAQLALESAPSVRCLFRQFLSKQTDASLNSYYRALGNGLVTDASIRQALALQALAIVPEALRQEPILLSVDDTSIAKWGKHFDGVGILYDHAKHDGKSYFNGHAFVSLTMSVPVLHETAGKQQIRYIAVPIGYVMSNGEASKLTLACQLLDEVMPILEKRQVILLFDSWYAKRELLAHALSYPNLNVTCNARHDTAMFELPDSTAGRRGRPPKYGKRLMLDEIANDLTNYLCRMDNYFVAHRLVKTRIFGDHTVHAYVTLSKSGSYRLFFSTIDPMALHMSIAWQENKGLRNTSSKHMAIYPLKLYKLRWGIETNYYEQKMFWELGSYKVRTKTAIEHLLNLTNSGHALMKILPYEDERLNTYRDGIYWQWYKSSVIIMVLQTVIGLFFGSMVGYGLAMYNFKGRNLIFTLVLVVMMIPFEILLLPLYRMLIRAKLVDNYFGVILPYLVPPFMIFFFRQYVLGLPKELLEAGRIDGCTDYGVFFRIMVPIMIPAFGAMTILSGMNSWNNLLWPMIVLSTNEKFTIPIGMGTTITPYGNAYDVLMPGAVMAVVPIIIIYLCAQKTFIAGLTAGSVKG